MLLCPETILYHTTQYKTIPCWSNQTLIFISKLKQGPLSYVLSRLISQSTRSNLTAQKTVVLQTHWYGMVWYGFLCSGQNTQVLSFSGLDTISWFDAHDNNEISIQHTIPYLINRCNKLTFIIQPAAIVMNICQEESERRRSTRHKHTIREINKLSLLYLLFYHVMQHFRE